MLSIAASCVRSLDLDDVIKAFACGVMGLTTNHKPTLPSRKSLMGINFR